MPRLLSFILIALLAAPGCSMLSFRNPFSRKQRSDPTVLSRAEIRQRQLENQQRLAGVDSPRHLSRTFLGVDVSGENPLMAVGHLVWGGPARIYPFINGDTPVRWGVE